MAINPMQRQKRVSYLLGMLTMLVISAIIIGIIGMQLVNLKKKEKEAQAALTTVYVLNADVSSGVEITPDMLVTKQVDKNTVPSDAFGDIEVFQSYSLVDEAGNSVLSDEEGMYIQPEETKIRIKMEVETGKYYKEVNGQKEYTELSNVPLVAKVDLNKNTVLTRDLVSKSDSKVTSDVRTQEYNMFTLPTNLETGDFVDVRIRFPSGLDYIVVAKKEVTIPDVAGIPSVDTININISEDETLTISNAIVEAYQVLGTELYVSKYTDPGMQQASIPTYPIKREIMELVNTNPNIVDEAKQALYARYNTDQRNNAINSEIQRNAEDADKNIESGITEHITKQQELRQQYLEALAGGTVQ